MSLMTKKPPYTPLEVERIARALLRREAWGYWLKSDHANVAFEKALKNMGAEPWLAAIEAGAIYGFEFLSQARQIVTKPGEIPRFATFNWADKEWTEKILHRLTGMQVEAGERACPRDELDDLLDQHDHVRVEELPEVRRRIKAARKA